MVKDSQKSLTKAKKYSIIHVEKDKCRGFWVEKSHGCFLTFPQANGFFAVCLAKNAEKQTLRNKEDIWQSNNLS